MAAERAAEGGVPARVIVAMRGRAGQPLFEQRPSLPPLRAASQWEVVPRYVPSRGLWGLGDPVAPPHGSLPFADSACPQSARAVRAGRCTATAGETKGTAGTGGQTAQRDAPLPSLGKTAGAGEGTGSKQTQTKNNQTKQAQIK